MRYQQVIMEKVDGKNLAVAQANKPESFNFRIVSHYGERDWSPYLGLREALQRFDTLPQRPDGYFLLVEG